jgi:hypothetical protein
LACFESEIADTKSGSIKKSSNISEKSVFYLSISGCCPSFLAKRRKINITFKKITFHRKFQASFYASCMELKLEKIDRRNPREF